LLGELSEKGEQERMRELKRVWMDYGFIINFLAFITIVVVLGSI